MRRFRLRASRFGAIPLGFMVVLSLLSIAVVVVQGQSSGSGIIGPPPPDSGQRTPTRAPGVPGDQAAPAGTAVIRGFIVAMESGTPIRRAQVRVFATQLRQSRVATTDAQGRFEFLELPAGRYSLSASKAGYVSLQYGQRRPMQAGTPIEIRDRQILEKVTIGLPRGSVIAGRITDEFGEPVAQANVMPMRWQRLAGAGRWTRTGPSATTDDLGQYRLFGLTPGEYLVSASLRGGGMGFMSNEQVESSTEATGFAPTYFPGVPSVGDAQRITVGVGEENTNASFALIATRLVSIEGTVTSAQGTAVTQGMVSLMADDGEMGGAGFMGPEQMGQIEKTGRFRISNVAPGRYMAQVRLGGFGGRGGPDGDSGEIGRTQVIVGGDKIENLAIVMTAGGRITGRVITDTGSPLPSGPAPGGGPEGLRVFASSANPFQNSFGPGGNARVEPDGSFSLRGLVDPRMVRVSTPPGWSVKSIMLSGRDYIDSPINVELGQTLTGMEVILTNRVSSVTGMVTDSRGQPVLDASIIIFPDDRQFWRFGSRHVRTSRPDQEGRYRIDNLPPFETYLAVAVQDMGEGQATDPAYLTTVQQDAARFNLREGSSASVDLKLRQ